VIHLGHLNGNKALQLWMWFSPIHAVVNPSSLHYLPRHSTSSWNFDRIQAVMQESGWTIYDSFPKVFNEKMAILITHGDESPQIPYDTVFPFH